MANKSSKSPSGEDREQASEYMRDREPDNKEVKANGDDSVPTMSPKKQENTDHKGYQEDQPQNPVRTGPAGKKEQDDKPAGEPDKSDRVMKNNKTGPGLG